MSSLNGIAFNRWPQAHVFQQFTQLRLRLTVARKHERKRPVPAKTFDSKEPIEHLSITPTSHTHHEFATLAKWPTVPAAWHHVLAGPKDY